MTTLIRFRAIVVVCVVASAPLATRGALAQTEAKSVETGVPIVSAAQAQKLVLGRDISIHLRDTTLRRALDELEKQSDLALDTSELRPETLDSALSIDVDTPSFARAFGDIADEAGLRLSAQHTNTLEPWKVRLDAGQSSPEIVQIGARPAKSLAPASEQGLFMTRLQGLSVTLFKAVTLTGETPAHAQNDRLEVALQMVPDPRLPLVGLPRLRATRAQDEQGRSLLPAPGAPVPDPYDSGFQDIWSNSNQTLRLAPPQSDAKTLAHLEGTATYLLPTKRELWTVPDCLNADKPSRQFQSAGQTVTATLVSAALNGNTVQATLKLQWPGARDDALQRQFYPLYTVASWMHLEDADGIIWRARPGGGSSGGDYVNTTTSFYSTGKRAPAGPNDPNAAPATAPAATAPAATAPAAAIDASKAPKLPVKFVFSMPTQWAQAEVPFSYQDVPLP